MLAIDTNVLVRYLTGDDPGQSSRARALVDGNDVFVGRTVVLEAEWVLRSVYGFAPAAVRTALRAFAGLPRVTVEDPPIVARALDLAEVGLDFADALHLSAAVRCEAMFTFDRKLMARARRVGAGDVREP